MHKKIFVVLLISVFTNAGVTEPGQQRYQWQQIHLAREGNSNTCIKVV